MQHSQNSGGAILCDESLVFHLFGPPRTERVLRTQDRKKDYWNVLDLSANTATLPNQEPNAMGRRQAIALWQRRRWLIQWVSTKFRDSQECAITRMGTVPMPDMTSTGKMQIQEQRHPQPWHQQNPTHRSTSQHARGSETYPDSPKP